MTALASTPIRLAFLPARSLLPDSSPPPITLGKRLVKPANTQSEASQAALRALLASTASTMSPVAQLAARPVTLVQSHLRAPPPVHRVHPLPTPTTASLASSVTGKASTATSMGLPSVKLPPLVPSLPLTTLISRLAPKTPFQSELTTLAHPASMEHFQNPALLPASLAPSTRHRTTPPRRATVWTPSSELELTTPAPARQARHSWEPLVGRAKGVNGRAKLASKAASAAKAPSRDPSRSTLGPHPRWLAFALKRPTTVARASAFQQRRA